MESPRHHLVPLLLLLLGLVGGAAAATGADSQAACEPTNLATQIALFCAPNMPTAPCCEPVVASVDLGGGVPCLCRVASQQQLILARLNASHLLALYTACGGLQTGGAHLAAACQGNLHLARLSLSLSGSVPVFVWRVPGVPSFCAIVFRFRVLVLPVATDSNNRMCRVCQSEPSLIDPMSRFDPRKSYKWHKNLCDVHRESKRAAIACDPLPIYLQFRSVLVTIHGLLLMILLVL
jgi:hypothetical protein